MNSCAGGVFPRFVSNLQAAAPLSRRNRRMPEPTMSGVQEGAQKDAIIETDIPFRLDALPFGRFHLLVIVALGVTWILDGLEVTLAGSLSGELMQHSGLGLSNWQIGLAGSCYLAGAVLGAVFFGWLTDRLRGKKLFRITPVIYLSNTRRP